MKFSLLSSRESKFPAAVGQREGLKRWLIG